MHVMNGLKPLIADPKDMQLIGIRRWRASATLLLTANPGLTKAGTKGPCDWDRILIYFIVQSLLLEQLIPCVQKGLCLSRESKQ